MPSRNSSRTRTERLDLKIEFRGRAVLVRKRPSARTIEIAVKPCGQIAVRVPANLSRREIRHFLLSQDDWIETQLETFQTLREAHPPKDFREGEAFYFFGRLRNLRFVSGSIGVWYSLRSNELICYVPDREALDLSIGQAWLRESLTEYYRRVGIRYLRSRLAVLAKRLNVQFESVRFASQKSRWGSCSAKGCISLNWRLIFAPPEVIDYILIHELTHLEYYDHSPEFWNRVAEHSPGHASQSRWLETHQYEVDFLAKRSELHPEF